MTSIFFQLNTCSHSPYVTSSLRKDGPVVYNCCWHSPAQSFSGPSSAGLMTTFCCLRFETPPTWRARSLYLYPPEQGGPVIAPGTGLPFCRLLGLQLCWCPRYITPWYEPRRKHRFQQFFYCCAWTRRRNLYVSRSLCSNGSTH
jgi:hypothetical protein